MTPLLPAVPLRSLLEAISPVLSKTVDRIRYPSPSKIVEQCLSAKDTDNEPTQGFTLKERHIKLETPNALHQIDRACKRTVDITLVLSRLYRAACHAAQTPGLSFIHFLPEGNPQGK